MKILAPVDGTECSSRALEFAIELAERFDGTLHVVHFSDAETEATEEILERAEELLAASDLEDDPELLTRTVDIRLADKVGKEILQVVEDEGYDHVVMGHEGAGRVERALLGSAAETVVRGETVPVTVVP
jgi:nucleotide-binding universal stress UspA family protein